MIRRPPRSTLFPSRRSSDLTTAATPEWDEAANPAKSAAARAVVATRPTTTHDRKSTRLNYSHVRISYAVFCLKKKKKKITHEKQKQIRPISRSNSQILEQRL